MKTQSIAILVCACVLSFGAVADDRIMPTPKIQIALLLDTSNSMDGLINQAKAQLWKVVNEFVTAECKGQRPEFQVALYEYGNNNLNQADGWVRIILPLTDDLDRVSEKLFALTTNGGDEYCGTVIQRAVKDLDWSRSPDDLKTIFIAGNEPFTQGEVDFRKACPAAIKKGIVVNTIFCGPKEEGISTHWKEGALLADGNYMNIDQDEVQVTINAPQDDEIMRLGQQLNTTYVAFGQAGASGAANQAAQDANALSLSPSANVSRQVAKSSAFYRAKSWDFVDAVEEGEVDLEEVKDEALPAALQGMTPEELKQFVEVKKQERENIQQQIQELNKTREAYIAAEIKKRGEGDKNTLDAAMIKAVKEQAAKKGFAFKK